MPIFIEASLTFLAFVDVSQKVMVYHTNNHCLNCKEQEGTRNTHYEIFSCTFKWGTGVEHFSEQSMSYDSYVVGISLL